MGQTMHDERGLRVLFAPETFNFGETSRAVEVARVVEALAGSGRPVIYVGLGSSAGRRLALDILHSIEDLDVEIVTSAGRYLSTEDRASLADNVHVYDFLPAYRLPHRRS